MYNHNRDILLFKAIKDYNRERETTKTHQSKLSGKLLAGGTGALISVGKKLGLQNQPNTARQSKTNLIS